MRSLLLYLVLYRVDAHEPACILTPQLLGIASVGLMRRSYPGTTSLPRDRVLTRWLASRMPALVSISMSCSLLSLRRIQQ